MALRVGGIVYLLDCGEGTQVPYKELHLGQRSLRLIAISHLHADHCLGLPGMLMLRAQMPDPGPLVLLGPAGLDRLIRHLRQDLPMFINYPIRVHEWSPGASPLAYEDEHLRILWRLVDHTVPTLGFRLEECGRPGRFHPQTALDLGVRSGPLWGRLQAGETVTLANGSQVTPEQVLGVPRRGRHVAYVTDTALCPSIHTLLHDADLAFMESMFLPDHALDAAEKHHLTVEQAVLAAVRARVRELVLVHVSPRYDEAEAARMDAIARSLHPRARLGRDSEVFHLPAPDGD